MKTKYLMLFILSIGIASIGMAQSKTDTIKVWGNCDMCKTKIEKAALSAGAVTANWNDESKLMVVSYDVAKTSNKDIQNKVAGAGYDTQDVRAADTSYTKLAKCCQYKRQDTEKAINASGGVKDDCCKDGKCSAMENCCKADMSCCKDKADKTACCSDGKCKSGK